MKFTIRQTGAGTLGGVSFGKLAKIKGYTLKWQQIVENGNFANDTITGWNKPAALKYSFNDGILTLSNISASIFFTQYRTIYNAHKYYYSFKAGYTEAEGSNTTLFAFGGTTTQLVVSNVPMDGVMREYKGIVTTTTSNAQYGFTSYPAPSGLQLMIDCNYGIKIIDLTLMFGSGNEPATVEEFEQLYPLEYYNYNAGTLVNNAATALKTTSSDAEWTLPLNLTTLTGKLNGEGSSVTIFPDGLKSAGSVCDEIVGNKAIKRIGKVDMGTLTWAWSNTINGFYATLPGKTTASGHTNNILCQRYLTDTVVSWNTNGGDKTCNGLYYAISGGIQVKDSAYATAVDFKSAMSGVMLYYELATPEEYILDEPLSLTYKCDGHGTEGRLPADTASSVLAPFRADIQYGLSEGELLQEAQKQMPNMAQAVFDSGIDTTGNLVSASLLRGNIYTKGETYSQPQVDSLLAAKADTSSLAEVATSGSYNDLTDKPTIQDGKSAYDIWKDAGHTGSEQDFLNSLVGNSGYSGAAEELQVVNNLVDGGATSALSAEMGKQLATTAISLANKIGDIPTEETQVDPNFNSGYISSATGEIVPSQAGVVYSEIDVSEAVSIRFLAPHTKNSGWTTGYAWYNAEDEVISAHQWDYGAGATANYAKEYNLSIPAGATIFRTSVNVVGNVVTESNYYCYLASGENVSELLKRKAEKDVRDFYASQLDGYYLNSSGAETQSTAAGANIKTYNVKPGDKYLISGYNASNQNLLAAFYDSGGTFIRGEKDNTVSGAPVTDYPVIVPADAMTMKVFGRDGAPNRAKVDNDREPYSFPQILNNIPMPRSLSTPLRILFIGSSWHYCTYWYLPKIIASAGINATLYSFFLGASTFEEWIRIYNGDISPIADTSRSAAKNISTAGGDWVVSARGNNYTAQQFHDDFMDALTGGNWDIIAIQNGARYSTLWSEWEPYPDYISIIKRHCGPNTVIAFNATFTPAMSHSYMYPDPSTIAGQKSWQQRNNYNTQHFLEKSGVGYAAPNGATMWTMRRNSSLNLSNDMATDGLHPDNGLPIYGLAGTWYETYIAPMYGIPFDQIDWMPDSSTQRMSFTNAYQSLSSEQRTLIRSIVRQAQSDRFGFRALEQTASTITPIQIVNNGDFSNGVTGWTEHSYCDASLQSVGVRLTKSAGSYGAILWQLYSGLSTTHTYYQKVVMRRGTTTANAGFCTSAYTVGKNKQMYTDSTSWVTMDQIIKPSADDDMICLRAGSGSSSAGMYAEFKSFMMIDLTATFGEGNEPSIDACRGFFPDDYYDYNV